MSGCEVEVVKVGRRFGRDVYVVEGSCGWQSDTGSLDMVGRIADDHEERCDG